MIALPVTCPVFIGREAELAALGDARRDLAKSRGSFVTVVGDAGVGKSRLVRQFAARTGDRRVRNLARAECVLRGTEPFRPIRSLVEVLLEAERPSGLSARGERAIERLAPDAASTMPRIDRADFFAGLLEFFAACAAKRSTILIVEDIHWADASTLDFFAYLAPRIERLRVLVIATCRIEEIGSNPSLLGTLARIEREPVHRRVALEPFDGDTLRTFLGCALEGRAPIDDSILGTIASRSEGNAFFAEELLKQALSGGARSMSSLPISVRGMIAERFASLATFTQRVISNAAVIGLRFDPTLLADIMACPVDELVAPLEAARDAAIIAEDTGERGLLRFRHALTRDAIYDELLVFDVRRLHQRILETLEARPSASLYALAEHAAAAGDRSRTLVYGERAGEASWALGGYAEAIASFELALAAARDNVDRARLTERLAFPISYTGDVRRALRLWEAALALHTERGDFSAAVRIRVVILCERFNIGDVADEGESLLAFLREHGAALTPAQRDRIVVLIACLRSELAHVGTVDALLDRLEAEANLPADVTQNIYLAKMNRAAYFGDVATWRAQLSGLRGLARVHEKASVEALNISDHLASVVVSGLYLGANPDLEAALTRGRALAIEWNFDRHVKHFDALEAAYLCSRGRFREAAARFFAASGESMYLTSILLARTAPWLTLALAEETFAPHAFDVEVIGREREAIRANPQSQHSRLFLGGYALCLARRGRHGEAAIHLDAAFTGIEQPSPRFAVLLATALRDLPAERIPNLGVFARADLLASSDIVGGAMATLARGAIEHDAARCAEAGGEFAAAGFPLIAAHAYHLGGMVDEAQRLYLRCGASAYVAASEPIDTPAAATPQLSQREVAVARYVADGLTNLAIAERLSISKKTVEKHLASIFRKYGLRSRSQIAARFIDESVRIDVR